jgi:hypothetical protein
MRIGEFGAIAAPLIDLVPSYIDEFEALAQV